MSIIENIDFENVYRIILVMCVTIIICFICVYIYKYNIEAVKYYTENGYVEATVSGHGEPVWVKRKQTK